MPHAERGDRADGRDDQADLRHGHARRRHLGLEHAGAACRAQRLRAAQVHRGLLVLTDADRTRHLLAVRVHGLDDVVALGNAVDGERRGAEVTALEEDLDLGFGRRLHGDAPQPLGVGRPEVDVAQAVRLGRVLRGVEDRLRLLDVARLLGRLFGLLRAFRRATLRRWPGPGCLPSSSWPARAASKAALRLRTAWRRARNSTPKERGDLATSETEQQNAS